MTRIADPPAVARAGRRLLTVLVAVLFNVAVEAQTVQIPNPESEFRAGESSPTSDSLQSDTIPSAGPDSLKPGRRVRASTAVLLSALIPGGGQFYTGHPLKGVLIGSAELGLAGLSIYQYQQGNTDLGNTFLWWTGFVLGFSMADAYVSASMYGFQEEQRLNVRVMPSGMALTYRF